MDKDRTVGAAKEASRWNLKLLSDRATPLSDWLGWAVLSKNEGPRSSLINDPTWLSSRFGWQTLINNAAPLSGKFGWRVLSDDPTPLSKKFGWRVLSEDQGSGATLSSDPAPLSNKLGIPTPSGDRSTRS